MSALSISANRAQSEGALHFQHGQADFSKALAGHQNDAKLHTAGIEVITAPPNPDNYDHPITDLFQITPAENQTPGFLDTNNTVTQTVFMSYARGRERLFNELLDIFEEINPGMKLAIYMENFHPDGVDFDERMSFIDRRFENTENIVFLPSLGHRPGRISDALGTFPEDAMTFAIDENGLPVVYGFGEERRREVLDAFAEFGEDSKIHPQRAWLMAEHTAEMFDGLEFREKQYLTYGGDLHIGGFESAAGDGETIQKQFFGRETIMYARERIFLDESSLPPHLQGLTEEQQLLYATALIMGEIEEIAGTASQAFPLGAGDTTIGETLASLPQSVLSEFSPSVLDRLEALSEFPVATRYAGDSRYNYHVDTFMVPLTNNIVLINEDDADSSFADMLRSDPEINLQLLPARTDFEGEYIEQRVSYMNMLTINNGEELHLILQTENSNAEELTEFDEKVRDTLEELGFRVHFVGYSAIMSPHMDWGLNCVTEAVPFPIVD